MLNPSQQEAVNHVLGPALVLAGAGAGKTSVLTQRVAQLISQEGFDPKRVLVVTFTNKAAKEMRDRLARLLGWKVVKTIWAGTFHSICCRILRVEIESLNLGYTRKFVIYDPKDQEKIMDLTLRGLNLDPKDYKAYDLLRIVSKFKNMGFDPDSVPSSEVDDPFSIRIYRAYQAALCQNNAMDFDDLLFLTLRLLRDNEEVRQRLQERFEQVLIDEYQDTNTVQFELVRTLSGHHRNIFAVGDVDQSIYSFRHANFRIILRFQEDYPDARIIKLEENYRSTGRILAAANDLIQNNGERFEKVLRATRGEGEPLRFHMAPAEDDEALYIASEIKRMNEGGQSFGNFAILYRTNAQSRLYEQKLIQYQMPYHVVGSFRFYDRREIKDMLSYMQVINNLQDSLSLKRILNVPKRGIGAKAIETLETSATFEGRGLTLFEAIQSSRVVDSVPLRAQEGFQFLASWLIELNQIKIPVSELLERIFAESGYKADLEAEKDPKKRQDRLDNVEALLQATIEFEVEAEDKTDLTAFLEKIALFSDSDKMKEDGQSIRLMTVHAAKGLEFPNVFLPAVEEGIFPHIRSILAEDQLAAIEEERRLMYVAITRAKNQLFLTFAASRRNKRAAVHSKLSRFVLEIAGHMHLPGDLLSEAQEHLRERMLKKMNIKGAQDVKGFDASPAVQVPGSKLPLHPLVQRMQAAQPPQQRPAPVTRPTTVASTGPLHPLIQRMQAAQNPAQVKAPASSEIGVSGLPQPLDLKVGDRVRHPKLGEGQVERVIPPLAKIHFATGVKTFNLSTSPLEVVS